MCDCQKEVDEPKFLQKYWIACECLQMRSTQANSRETECNGKLVKTIDFGNEINSLQLEIKYPSSFITPS